MRATLALLLAIASPLLAAPLEPAEEAVLARIAARDLAAARAGVLALRPAALESARARRVDLLDLGVALAALEGAATDGLPPARQALLARLDRMRARVDPRDLGLLLALETALGPTGTVYLAPLRRAARAAIGPRQPRSLLVELARDADPELRRLGVSALVAQLAPFRARVVAGEDLSPSEQRALANPELIRLLIERLGDRGAGGAGDHLAPDLSAPIPGVATALHGLVLIETPALPALRAGLDRAGTQEAIAAIEDAIAARLRRHPGSTWCSARGQAPTQAAVARVPCPGCKAALPAGARHCPACGLRVRSSCPSCLAALEPGAAWCSGCGAGASALTSAGRAPPTCPTCRAPVSTPGRFCPECGAELRVDREE